MQPVFSFFSRVLNFEAKVLLEIQKQYFKILVMKKHWNKVVSCLPRRVLPNMHFFPFQVCCAVVNKLSTLFDFAVHCKTRDFNISLDELLFIQVFKGNL